MEEPTPLAEITQNIEKTCKIARRKPEEVTLVAVSKRHSAEAIRPLLEEGHRTFGENRVEEAADKWPELLDNFPDVGLHLVGQLQSKKADDAVRLFDCIHSLDRMSLVKSLAKAMDAQNRRIPCFVQVNIGEEPQKGGCLPAELPGLIAAAEEAEIPLAGLMCLPPANIEPAPFFALLDKLARDHGLDGRSMGMSGDYETAIMLGATHIRIGTALFGARD